MLKIRSVTSLVLTLWTWVDNVEWANLLFNVLTVLLLVLRRIEMTTKGPKNVVNGRKTTGTDVPSEDLFDGEFPGEFADLPKTIENPIGVVARLVCSNGGYFGLSITDDGGSARLAIRTGKFVADKRFYRLTELEAALSKAFSRLREVPPAK